MRSTKIAAFTICLGTITIVSFIPSVVSYGEGVNGQVSSSQEVAKKNLVKIVSISPDVTKPLHVRDKVSFEVKVSYELNEPSGVIFLNIQKGEIGKSQADSVINSKSEAISRGQGTVTFKTTIVVPSTKTIQVFTPLLIQGVSATKTVDLRAYKVLNKR